MADYAPTSGLLPPAYRDRALLRPRELFLLLEASPRLEADQRSVGAGQLGPRAQVSLILRRPVSVARAVGREVEGRLARPQVRRHGYLFVNHTSRPSILRYTWVTRMGYPQPKFCLVTAFHRPADVLSSWL